jgi:ferrochelatase
VREEYALIGGASPINPHTERQAHLLEARLNDDRARSEGVTYRVYTAMRYGTPSSEDAAAAMQRDGVTSVVLLPLYPQYSKTTTGASLSYWHALSLSGELHKRPTTLVKEYAAHPCYIRAISERIDEGLARFRGPTEDVFLLFSAHGTPVKEMKKRRDPYCCLVHSTVHRVMVERAFDRDFQVAFQSKVGPVEWLTPSTPDALESLSESGRKRVLVIPVAFVSDHVETVFELDIEVRHQAMEAGIEAFEVTEGLNDHPAFIDALVDVTLGQIRTGVDVAHEGLPGMAPQEHPLTRPPCFEAGERSTACNQCLRITEARRWDVEPEPEVSMI